MTLTASQLLEDIYHRLAVRRERNKIVAYWWKVGGSRNDFATQVKHSDNNDYVVPLVVGPGFKNANELMADLRHLIEDHESELASVAVPTEDKPLILLLLSHDELRIPQIASPTVLPDWFPGIGGSEVSVWIEDLTWTAELSANAVEVQLDELHLGLYCLDVAMTARLQHIVNLDHNCGAGWFSEVSRLLKDTPPKVFKAHLQDAEEKLAKVTDRRKYRLELKLADTPLASGVVLVSQTAPDNLGKIGKLLTSALRFRTPHQKVRSSLFSILACSTNPDNVPERTIGRNLLLSAYATHRLLTIGSHADQYPMYPLSLLKSVALDLRSSLAQFSELLSLDATG